MWAGPCMDFVSISQEVFLNFGATSVKNCLFLNNNESQALCSCKRGKSVCVRKGQQASWAPPSSPGAPFPQASSMAGRCYACV